MCLDRTFAIEDGSVEDPLPPPPPPPALDAPFATSLALEDRQDAPVVLVPEPRRKRQCLAADLHSQALSGHFSNVFASKKEEPDSCARGCQIAKKIATSEHQIAKKMVNSEGICSPFACEGGATEVEPASLA